MDERINKAVTAIEGENAEVFLRFMAAAFYRRADNKPAAGRKLAAETGMIRSLEGKVELTSPGFLVANVAKEYCNYVDQGRTMAPPKPTSEMVAGKDVLDLGCSFGRSLWEFQRRARRAVGLEPQEEYIALGRALSMLEKVSPPPRVANGTAEDLRRHFDPESFDLVFARLVLNYCRIKPVLDQAVAVLRPRGMIWFLVESPLRLPKRFFAKNTPVHQRGWILLAMLNVPVCIATGRQVSISWHGRMHARHNPGYLPLWWWRNEMEKRGLRNFRLVSNEALAFCAEK